MRKQSAVPYDVSSASAFIVLMAKNMPEPTNHAGTKSLEHLTLTSGGRVLGVTALGDDLADAQHRAYAAVKKISFEGAYSRGDIGNKALTATAKN